MGSDRMTVVVTGSSGIAAAGARALLRAGASVFVIGREAAEIDELVADLGGDGTVDAAVADLTDEAATEAAFLACHERFGRVDGLFAVAGGSGRRFGDGPLHDLTLAGWEATHRINAYPTFLAVREAVRTMRGQPPDGSGMRGAVVVVTSVLAHAPSPARFGTVAYAAVKGGQAAMVRQLAAAYAPEGIRVNAVAPGLVATPMAARAAADADIVAYAGRKQPLAGGLLPADAVADAAVFLLGESSRYVTGQVLDVDGGWSVTEAAP
jgi:NAD(P)-dependent dehydrogenase (short-subunit alcohol dehydrogenase family)